MKNSTLVGLLAAFGLAAGLPARAQVGIGTATPNAKAALEIASPGNNKGLLIPRLTAGQRTGIVSPPQGLMVYQTDGTAGGGAGTGFWYFAGTGGWVLVNPTGADNLGNHTATQALNLQANALQGTGASLGTAVGLGIRADGGLNLGQNTAHENMFVGYLAGANNDTGSHNAFLGREAGSDNNTGVENVYVGNDAGRGADGGGNVAVGYRAAYRMSSGNSNTLLGWWAGLVTTTGSNNLFAGTASGSGNQGGNNNVYLGYSTGVSNVGSSNVLVGALAGNAALAANEVVAVGHEAGRNNKASGNHFVGYQAGLNTTTGSSNHFDGYQAGLNNDKGYVNTAVGNQAGLSLFDGYSNTFLGWQAGYNTNSGHGNVFLGLGTGYGNQGGADNVYLGNSTGFFSTGNQNVFVGATGGQLDRSGDNNTTLGYGASPAASALTNTTALGYNARVSQSNSLVLGGTGTDAVRVGIGTAAPSATLAVLRGTAPDGTAAFAGTARTSHFSYATAEDTYIRGGKATANVLLNDNGGSVGIGTTAPYSLLANTATNIVGADGFGVGSESLAWSSNLAGYVGAVFNAGTGAGRNGLAVKVAGATATATALDVSQGAVGTAGVSLLTVQANGYVGLGTAAPAATLEVRRGTAPDGTAAFRGTTRNSNFSYATAEDTYIRGGKATSNVLLNDNGGNVGVRTATPNSGLQVNSSLSVPFRTVAQTAGSYVNVTLSDDDHTLRSGSPTGVTGGAVFSFLLPNPVGRAGRVCVLLNYGDTPANLYANNGSTAFGLSLIYDDASSTYITQSPANSRLTLQSDGATWLVLAR